MPFSVDEARFARAARNLARDLAARGLGRGDRVAVLAGNVPGMVVARDAAARAGLYVVPVNAKLTPPEVGYVLEASAAMLCLVDPPLRAIAVAAGSDAEIVDLVVDDSGPPAERFGGYGGTIIFTSGTTGQPKGCVRTEAQEAARGAELVSTYGLGPDDVHLIACPLAHSAPGIFLRAAREAGAATVVCERFTAEGFLAAVEHHRATIFFLVPTQYERLLALPEETRARYDLGSVRAALVAGAPIAPATKERLVAWLGEGILWEFYGSSETGTVTVLRPEDQLAKPGSVGRPPPGVSLTIVDGEVYVRSAACMRGYLDADVDRKDGHISVGDLGRLDDDGYLYLLDRKHDTIISGGVNVYPAEVERALWAHPRVTGAVCFGVPDADWGEKVCAVVAPRDLAGAEDELRAFLRERLAPFKIPKAFAFCDHDELPVGPSGKPLRRAARETFGLPPRGEGQA